ncbi:MAG: hypothetical protein MI974_23920 [Chitinophagales bacterium]|nr:hypothetical protein [Chitinophagales bacterium]
MKNILFPLLILVLAIGCKKDEITITDSFDHCIERNEQVIASDSCPTSLDDYHCEIIEIGADSLGDESRSYLPQYCLMVKDTLRYENNSGELTIYTVTEKLNLRTFSLQNSFIECNSDSSETIAYCSKIDLAELRLKSINKNISLKINISNILDNTSPELGLSGDKLSICRGGTIGSFCTEEFYSIINQKDLTYDQSEREERINKIELNGVQYNDVISNINNNPISNGFKYYYNRQIGLIAYLDENGELWTIKQ